LKSLAGALVEGVQAVVNPDLAGRRLPAEMIESCDGRQIQQVEGVWNQQNFLDHCCPPSMGAGIASGNSCDVQITTLAMDSL
jgi:hypothetical protein